MDKVIVYLAIKYKGDWDAIYKAIMEKENVDVKEVERVVSECPYNYITILDDRYPMNIKHIYKPPFVLFYKGNLELLHSKKRQALVSTRKKLSPYARRTAKVFAQGLSNEGIVQVLADGESVLPEIIDEIKSSGGSYIKVLSKHIEELDIDDYDNFLVVTEYPEMPEKHKGIVSQCKLIGAIPNGMIVVETGKKDRCLLSITRALENSLDICAVPHAIDDNDYCNTLIKDGARLVESVKDIIEY